LESRDLGSIALCGSGATKGEPEAVCAAITDRGLS
jgi:hypothetical protein